MRHEIIYTDNYEFIVSDEEIKYNEYYIGEDNHIYCLTTKVNPNGKKLIAHQPLKEADIIQGVPLINETYGGNK
jgi:hypothetical protein